MANSSEVTFYVDDWDSEAELSDLESFPGDFFDEDIVAEKPWTTVSNGRRGGKASVPSVLPSKTLSPISKSPAQNIQPLTSNSLSIASPTSHSTSSTCALSSSTARKTRRFDKPRSMPISPLGRPVGCSPAADEVSMPKRPSPSPAEDLDDFLKRIPGILNNPKKFSNDDIVRNLRRAVQASKEKKDRADYYLSDAGQRELLLKAEERAKRHLCPLDYTEASKATLSATGPAGGEEWIEVEFCADTGACDTVMPRVLCESIAITPSLQSLACLEYEVANKQTLPNLGERKCLVWTEGAGVPRPMNIQVADIHKPLLSLSRCADMGYESRFGKVAGALIDDETGDVIPLIRKGNLYVLKCWLKAAPAPFGRQDR